MKDERTERYIYIDKMAPYLTLVFNLLFSYYPKQKQIKKSNLLLGIYLRAISFLGMALFTYFFGLVHVPSLAFASFFLWIFVFSISVGLARNFIFRYYSKDYASSEKN